MSWHFGNYIKKVLQSKQWNQSRLAEESGISTGHISWIINGETAGKDGPPNIGLDLLVSLKKALDVSYDEIISAYYDEPYIPKETTEQDLKSYRNAFQAMLKELPSEEKAQLVKDMPAEELASLIPYDIRAEILRRVEESSN